MPDPEITLLSVFFLVGAAQGVLFALALFSGKSTDQAASRYLAFLLLIFSTELLSEFLDHSQYGLQYIRLMILIYPVDFLYGPLVWLYASKMCSRPSPAKRFSTCLHFIPALIYAPIVWQLLFQPLPGNAGFFIVHPLLLQPNQIQSWISLPLTQELAILHIAAYLFASLWRLRRHSIDIEDVCSFREGVALTWLRRLLLALLLLLGLFVVRVLVGRVYSYAYVDMADTILNSVMVIVIYAMAYFAARQPRIFTRRISSRAPGSASPRTSAAPGAAPEPELSEAGDDSNEVESNGEEYGEAEKSLAKLGVEIRLGHAVTHCDADGVIVADERLPSEMVLWAAGVAASPAAVWLGTEADRAGRVIVGEDLSIAGNPDVFVIGDTASVNDLEGNPVPGIAPAAKQQGKHVANLIRSRMAGRLGPAKFRYRHTRNLATIGRKSAVIELPFMRLTGLLAWWIWGIAHIYFLIGVRSPVLVALNWLRQYVTYGRGARLITGMRKDQDYE